jgi:hypothetical protein
MHTNLHHVLVPYWTCKPTSAQFTTCMYTPLSMVQISQLWICCGNSTIWQPSQNHCQIQWHAKWMHNDQHHVLVTHSTCKPTRPNSQHMCTHHYQWCNSLNYKHVVVTEPHGKLANIIAKDNDIQIGCTLTCTMCWLHIEHANQQVPNSQHAWTHQYQWCNSLYYIHIVGTKSHGKLANIIAKHNEIRNGCTLTYTLCWWHIQHANQQGPIHNMHVHTNINGAIFPITYILWEQSPMAN